MEKYITESFLLRGYQLISSILEEDVIIVSKNEEVDYLKQLADKKIESVVEASFVESSTLEERAKKAEFN